MENNKQDQELLTIFLEEADDLLIELSKTLMLWQKDEHLSWMADLKRDLHTLKGGARMLHQHAIADLAHEIEDLCEALRTETLKVDNTIKALLLLSLDSLGAMIVSLKSGKPLVPQDEIIQQIKKLTSEAKSTSVSHEQEIKKTQIEQKQLASPVEDVVRVRANVLEHLNTLSIENNLTSMHLAEETLFLKNAVTEIKQTVKHLNDQLDILVNEFNSMIGQGLRDKPIQTENKQITGDVVGFGISMRRIKGDLLDLKNITNRLTEVHHTLDAMLVSQARTSMELLHRVSDTRLVAFDSIVPRLGRMARQISLELKKNIDFRVERSEGQIDRTMLEHLIPALEHIVRNAIDHGIETPEKRLAENKPEMGSIRVSFFRIGDLAAIEIKDDGAGIDVTAVKQRAVKLGLLPETETREDEIIKCIFEPGFSTRESATQISGRGVGLDVVSTAIKELGGSLSIASQKGIGTKIILKFPFTISLNRILICSVQGHRYGILLSDLENAVQVSMQELKSLLSAKIPVFKYENKSYYLHTMETLLNYEKSTVPQMNVKSLPLLLFELPEYPMAVVVDDLLYRSEFAVQSLGAQFKLINECSGGIILGDGTVAFVLDPLALSMKIKTKKQLDSEMFATVPQQKNFVRKKPLVLVVDDSVTLRTFAKRMLERHQYKVMTAEDGIDALQRMESDTPDLIVTDLDMPRMDGFEFAAALKQHEKYKRIPIMIVTSHSVETCKAKAQSFDIQDVFAKPYGEDLMKRIKVVLEGSDV